MWRKHQLILCITLTTISITGVHGEVTPVESWTYQAGEGIGESPKFYPDADRPTHVVVVSQEGGVSLVDSSGKAVWKTELGGVCAAPVGIGDLDGDGTAEIVAALHDGDVFALDASGTVLWRYKMDGRISNYRCPALADLNGDGQCEVIMTDDRGFVVCLSHQGTRKWKFRIDPFYASPVAVADLDLDGQTRNCLRHGERPGRLFDIQRNREMDTRN